MDIDNSKKFDVLDVDAPKFTRTDGPDEVLRLEALDDNVRDFFKTLTFDRAVKAGWEHDERKLAQAHEVWKAGIDKENFNKSLADKPGSVIPGTQLLDFIKTINNDKQTFDTLNYKYGVTGGPLLFDTLCDYCGVNYDDSLDEMLEGHDFDYKGFTKEEVWHAFDYNGLLKEECLLLNEYFETTYYEEFDIYLYNIDKMQKVIDETTQKLQKKQNAHEFTPPSA